MRASHEKLPAFKRALTETPGPRLPPLEETAAEVPAAGSLAAKDSAAVLLFESPFAKGEFQLPLLHPLSTSGVDC